VLGATGYGAGSRDPEDRPNVLRVMEFQPALGGQGLRMLQADLDDMPPEYAAEAQAAVLAAGALDAVVLPLGMKKGRQGLRLEALVRDDALDAVLGAVLAHTSTLGVRHWAVNRAALPRSEETREWRGQSIRVKWVDLPDGSTRWKPEFEDVARAARALGMPAHEARRALERELGKEGSEP